MAALVTMQPLPRLVTIGLTLWVVLSTAVALRSQEIVAARWGFDGRVRTATYNLLTVEVRNPTSDPWEDALVLSRSSGVARIGLEHAVPVFLAPGQTRRVQFAAYVANETDGWSLRWQAGQLQGFDVPPAREGQSAFVLLDADDGLQRPIKNLRSFPAGAFPTTVAVTDLLDDVVLDHVPDFDGPRRRAFLDWLRKGGRLHVLRDAAARPLRFGSGDFEGLDDPADEANATFERLRYGAGEIYRYPLTRAQMDKGGFRRKGLEFNPLQQRDRDERDIRDEQYRPDDGLLANLRSRVQPDHSWGLIFLLALAFVVMVGPVHWWLVRRKPEFGPRPATARAEARGHLEAEEDGRGEVFAWRRPPGALDRLRGGLGWVGSIVYLVAVVLLFTWLFLRVGARGYGEATRLDTLAVAESLGDGRWDVDAISNLFVTSGDSYRIDVPGEQGVVSAGPVREPVRGEAVSGRGAHLVLDVPLFSAQRYVRRSIAAHAGPVVRAESWGRWAPAGRVEQWPDDCEFAYWISDDSCWDVDAGLRLTNPVNLGDKVRTALDRQAQLSGVWGGSPEAPPELKGQLLAFERLGLLSSEARKAFRLRRDGVLLVMTRLPEDLEVSGLDVAESGFVVYIVRVPRPSQ